MNEQLNQPAVAEQFPALSVITPLPNPIRSRRPYKSKITSLPPDVRAFLNQSIYDNLPYDDIIQQLADKGHPGLNRNNISRWVKSGYRDWLAQKERVESIVVKCDGAEDFVKQFESSGASGCGRLNTLVIAAQMCQALQNFDGNALATRLNSNPELFFKMARIAHAHALERHRDEKIKMHAKQHNIDRPLGATKEDHEAVKLAFGLESWPPPQVSPDRIR